MNREQQIMKGFVAAGIVSGTNTETESSGTNTETESSSTNAETESSSTNAETESSGTDTETESSGTDTETESSGADTETESSGIDTETESSDTDTETGASENSELSFDSMEEGSWHDEDVSESETMTDVSGSTSGTDVKYSALWAAVIVLAALVIALSACCVNLFLKKKKLLQEKGNVPEIPALQQAPEKKEAEVTERIVETPKAAEMPKSPNAACRGIGKVHNIGRRSAQQDSLGVTPYRGGILAVVADGMGGLSDGDKVSQKIVLTMMQDSASLVGGSTDGKLYQMIAHANREVNHMLGISDQYKSGSTLIAVLVEAGYFQWVSVGDSRIYLYRGGQLMQINREHVYERDLLQKAVNCEISFGDIAQNPQRKSVSSFIGMGELKYIDGSTRPVSLRSDDRLLLMSDGVFNVLSEQEICDVLRKEKQAEKAAAVLESQVLARQNPKQDNFTAIILDI